MFSVGLGKDAATQTELEETGPRLSVGLQAFDGTEFSSPTEGSGVLRLGLELELEEYWDDNLCITTLIVCLSPFRPALIFDSTSPISVARNTILDIHYMDKLPVHFSYFVSCLVSVMSFGD